MNETVTTNLMTPIIQYGFAGFSVILLIIIIWLIRELLKVIRENNKVIAANTVAIAAVDKHSSDALDIIIELKDELLKRPCIAKFKQE
ncbi:MAG: hypothetical protein ABSG99_02725 [Sedimentisphaerales bacterium]